MSFDEQIMTKNKYLNIYLCQSQMDAIGFIVPQIFFAHAQFHKVGNVPGYSPVSSGEYLVT